MAVRLPFSKKKRYLTGIDWIINMFDHMLKRRSGAGNTSQIILELDGRIPEVEFRNSCEAFSSAFPVLRGTVARDINLAPYWKIPSRPPPGQTPIEVVPLSGDTSEDEALRILSDAVGDPFPGPSHHLGFRIVYQGEKRCWLGMRFDHRLFDARGAEAFLDFFEQRRSGATSPDGRTPALTEPAHLSNWIRKFKAGQQVNRALLAASKADRPRRTASSFTDSRTRFAFLRFSPGQSERLRRSAYDKAGYLMLMPYLLARSIRTFHRVLSRKKIATRDYVIPVSLDTRPPDPFPEKLFFNHVSFLFFAVTANDVIDEARLLKSLVEQTYEQTKSGLRESIGEASMLMRIAPLGLLAHLAHLPLDGEFGTMNFSQVGKAEISVETFMGARILNVLHSPRVPIPPGIGFFFNQFQDRLNGTISYLPGLLDESDLADIMADLGNPE